MRSLEKKLPKLECVYRLTGDDVLMEQKALHMIESACDLQMPEFNKAVFDYENFDASKIILSCQQLPFVSAKRLVIVKNILKVKENDIKKLEDYCQNPLASTVLVFVEVVNQNVFSKLSCEKVLCKKMSTEDLTKFIFDEFAKGKKDISKPACLLLVEFCGNDLLRIKNELTKLLCYGKPLIDEQDIKKLVKKNDDFSVFEISTALTLGQGDKAIKLMKKMLETSEFPIILGLISAHFRRMLYAVISEGSISEIALLLGVKEFAITKAKAMAKGISPMQLLKINSLILDMDYSIKIGKMTVENAMFYLVFKIVEIVKGEK